MPASTPILDLSTIDLSQTRADREAIARHNAHRGQMIMVDRVIWVDETLDHAVAVKHVRPDEFWVDGHIPGNPIMPGVLMVEAAAQLASWMYYRRSQRDWFAGFTRIDETTFRGQVVPGDDLYLVSRCLKYHVRRFVSEVQGFVDGAMVFESKISGMAFPNVPNPERAPLTEAERRAGQEPVRG
jgi:3-hydroxyacyl-[acyl-carrier-protein] dehydratase